MKKILSLLCVFSLLFCLFACADEAPNGKYTLFSMTSGDNTVNAEQLNALKIEMYIIFNSDGTGVLGFGSGVSTETQNFTWKGTGITAEDGDTMDFSFDGTTVTLAQDDTTLVFK